MLRLLGLVISVGLADSLNPSTIGPALFLAADRGAARKVAAFTGATFVVYLLGGLLLILGPGRAILALVPHPSHTVRYALETAVGAALLIAAPIFWRRREKTRAKAEAEPDDGGSAARRSPVVLGASISVVELPTAFPYLAVVAAITGSGLGLEKQLFLVVVYNVCFVLPLVGIGLAVALAGEAAVERLRRVRTLLRRNWPAVAAVVSLLAGLFVLVLGVTGLTSGQRGSVGQVSRRLRHFFTHPG